jgi:hypothetical protein
MRILPRGPSNSMRHSDKPAACDPINSTNVGDNALAPATALHGCTNRLSLPYSRRRICALRQTPCSRANTAAAAHNDSGIDTGRWRMPRPAPGAGIHGASPSERPAYGAHLQSPLVFPVRSSPRPTLPVPAVLSHAGPPKTHVVLKRCDIATAVRAQTVSQIGPLTRCWPTNINDLQSIFGPLCTITSPAHGELGKPIQQSFAITDFEISIRLRISRRLGHHT